MKLSMAKGLVFTAGMFGAISAAGEIERDITRFQQPPDLRADTLSRFLQSAIVQPRIRPAFSLPKPMSITSTGGFFPAWRSLKQPVVSSRYTITYSVGPTA